MSKVGEKRTLSASTPEESLGRATVLVIDDEPEYHKTIRKFLLGYRVLSAGGGRQGLRMLKEHHVDVVLLDLQMPDLSGQEVLDQIKASRQDVEVIVITSHAEIPVAVACVKAGAFDFLAKSFENYEKVATQIERALEHRRRCRVDQARGTDDVMREGLAQISGTKSPEMRAIAELLQQVAPTPLTVLLEGESGVGKELLARYLHAHSHRPTGPFVPVNVAAIPAGLVEATLFGHEQGAFTGADKQRLGKFELADRGTIFLDEIGELDLAFQAKLLRVLQEREVERIGAAEAAPVDVRVIAATNKDLEAEVVAGRFREDLWYRLNVVRVKVPPLRERKEDLPQLVELLGRRHGRTMGREPPTLSAAALRVLTAYTWPGNVRELENLVMRLVALHRGPTVDVDDLPVEYCVDHLSELASRWADKNKVPRESLYDMACDQFERYFVRHVVERCDGSMTEAAKRLGVSYSTVKNKMGVTES